MNNFLNELCLINIQIISFNFFNLIKMRFEKIMQELIKLKHNNFKINFNFNIKLFLELNVLNEFDVILKTSIRL